MKSEFRTTIEDAILSVRGGSNIVDVSCVFVDRNKCSDRIKFSFRTASDKQLKQIKAKVEAAYPGEHVNISNVVACFRGYGGVAVSVSHDPGKRL